ncbi:phenylalanine--tRNA ligase subunit beta [Candidatus Microgenomates bacterium]|nr:phenylalanine--tRNA ligase subunit beta [Candidatus Microgenomates bacterium]
MNILIADTWLREYLQTDATPRQIKDCLSLCGPSVERLKEVKDDVVYDVEITSNRVDMACVYGFALEAAAILPRFGLNAQLKPLTISNLQTGRGIEVAIEDKNKLCNRIVAVALDDVKVGPLPEFMRERIEKSDIRSLNNLIDITNYVMTELGHPCHVFDLDRIKTGRLVIRYAKNGEHLVTLDGKKYELESTDVVIDDGTGRIIDLPGIMGTENSVVTNQTKRVLLFIESNDPVKIRKTSMRLGIRTVAATINEKHPDPELAKTALLRGIELLQKHAGAKVVSPLYDIYSKKTVLPKIKVSTEFINTRLGITLTKTQIAEFLQSLNFSVSEEAKTILEVTPPTYRQFDIEIPEDIVEEVARLYGYHLLPNRIMEGPIPLLPRDQSLLWEEQIKKYLKYNGLTEIYNYSMLSTDLLRKTGFSENTSLKLANPLTEELVYMRNSLIPQMIKTISDNQNQKNELMFFELSKIYLPRNNNLPTETTKLCLGYLGKTFFELKGIIEGLAQELGREDLQVKPITTDTQLFVKNQCGEVLLGTETIGVIGLVKKNIALNFLIKNNLHLADLDFEKIVTLAKSTKNYVPLNPFPPLVQDLALVVKPHTYFANLVKEIEKISVLIKKVELLDEYANTKTLRIIFHDRTKTLEEKEIAPIRQKILKTLEEKFSAKLKLNS